MLNSLSFSPFAVQKQMSLQETEEPAGYPTTSSLPRQNTISSATPSSTKPKSPANHVTSTASSKQPATKTTTKTTSKGTQFPHNCIQKHNSEVHVLVSSSTKLLYRCESPFLPPPAPAPPPPSASPPAPRAAPPPSDSSRGSLLDSIHSFAKGKLKKPETKDRSGPLSRK